MDRCTQDFAREGPERIDRLAEGKSRQGDGGTVGVGGPEITGIYFQKKTGTELPVRAVPRRRPPQPRYVGRAHRLWFGQAASTFVHVRNGNLKAYAVWPRRDGPRRRTSPPSMKQAFRGFTPRFGTGSGCRRERRRSQSQTQFSGAGCLGRRHCAAAICRSRPGRPTARAADARSARRPTEGRDREMVADPQGGEHQGGMTARIVRSDAVKLPRRHFCIWQRALPRCRLCRASRGRKAIRRGRCGWSSASPPAARPTSSRA